LVEGPARLCAVCGFLMIVANLAIIDGGGSDRGCRSVRIGKPEHKLVVRRGRRWDSNDLELLQPAYGREARSYALVLFLTTVSSYTFVRALRSPSPIRWSFYVVLTASAVYSHLYALLVPIAHLTSLVLWRRHPIPWRQMAAAAAVLAVLLLPAAAYVAFAGQSARVPGWQADVKDIDLLFDWFTGHNRPLLLLYFLACSGAVLSALLAYARLGPGFEVWRIGFLVSGVVLPIAIAFFISQVHPIFA
jgi:uncharacterized membrane protein